MLCFSLLALLGFGASLHFFWRNVFDVSGYPPLVADSISNRGISVPVKHVSGRPQ